MIRLAGRTRQQLAPALCAASVITLLLPLTGAAQGSEPSRHESGIQTTQLQREAPVFTYRRFTAQLPRLSDELADDDQAGSPAAGLPAEPVLPVSDDPTGRRRAGVMGRFNETFDASSAREGLVAGLPDEQRSSTGEPETTAAVADQQPAPAQQASATKARLLGTGRASWYQHPGRTANGEIYNPNTMTAAHHSLPFGTRVKVVNKKNGRSVVVRITDRTNERTKAKRNYAIDLSRASAKQLGIDGIGMVALYKVE